MPRLLTISAVALSLLPAAFGLASLHFAPAMPGTAAALAQQRFQTNFCYKQYRSQADVARCLANRV
jgi:hypothetical protein